VSPTLPVFNKSLSFDVSVLTGGKTVDPGIKYFAGFTDRIESNAFRVFSTTDFGADINLRQFKFDGNESIVPIVSEFVTAVYDFRMVFQQARDVHIGNRDLAFPWDAGTTAQQANHCPKTEKLFHKCVKLLVHLAIVLHAAKKEAQADTYRQRGTTKHHNPK